MIPGVIKPCLECFSSGCMVSGHVKQLMMKIKVYLALTATEYSLILSNNIDISAVEIVRRHKEKLFYAN